ncbi:MAG: hypothetical protein KDE33_23315 [Bacteroidetes bacterium]|nr:hypothetical protein [Bacteroidota bacterium]
MSFQIIQKNRKPLSLYKATISPTISSKTVLVQDTWDYVRLWLKRQKKNSALLYWEPAKHFYDATKLLPRESAGLTAYYSFLNATKTLLSVKGIQAADHHGVEGKIISEKCYLANEQVIFKTGGVLPGLSRYLQEAYTSDESYTLKDLLYNLAYIHRAYCLTFSTSEDIFVPIKNPRFVKKVGSKETWFCFDLENKYATQATLNKIGQDFEKDNGISDKFTVRKKKRFNYNSKNMGSFIDYHKKIRFDTQYIYSSEKLWYIKKKEGNVGVINRSPLTLAFAAMHRISELCRYKPERLVRHFESQNNWLLSEFITIAPTQYIDQISSEITGYDFMLPGYSAR